MGSSPSASLNFDLMAPWPLYERLREAVSRPVAAPPRAAAETASGGNEAAEPDSATPPEAPPPQVENWLGGYCCTTYVMLSRESNVSGAELNEKLAAFPARHVPAEQLQDATLTTKENVEQFIENHP